MKLPSRTVPDIASQRNFEKLEQTVDSAPVTSLPTTDLYVGRRIVYAADAANGVYWDLVLTDPNATYPWKYVGGPPLFDEDATGVSTASTTYITTNSPSIVMPALGGDFDIAFGGRLHVANPAGGNALLGMHVNAVLSTDIDHYQGAAGSGTLVAAHGSREVRYLSMGSGATVDVRLASANAAYSAVTSRRWLRVTPVRVG